VAICHGLVAAASAAVSLVLITRFGFAVPGDPAAATWIYAIYAVVAMVAALWAASAPTACIGGALLQAAFIQAIVFRYAGWLQLQQPWVVALLAFATAAVAGTM
jgi:hypothetical protein